jgi:hypothetical protein
VLGIDQSADRINPARQRHGRRRRAIPTQSCKIRREGAVACPFEPRDYSMPTPAAMPGAMNENIRGH